MSEDTGEIPLPCDWTDAGVMHTHLLCPTCGSPDTTTSGYASHWRCSSCRGIAEAFVLCHADGSQVQPYYAADFGRNNQG